MRHLSLARSVALTAVAAVVLVAVPAVTAAARPDVLPLGDADLVETRTEQVVADGVTLTRIVRGTEPAPADRIATTTRGPWVIDVLTIDPAAAGRLEATYGPDLARVEPTSALVDFAGAVAGVNASFFTFTADPAFPGDPVGLGILDGELVSEPTPAGDEVHMIIDSTTDEVLFGRLTWTGSVTNRDTGAALPLEFVNHPPVVPPACATLVDQARCAEPGDVVRFGPAFAASTPAGHGVEVVLDGNGCVVRTAPTRGVALAPDQTSLQATGRDVAALLAVAGSGCVDGAETLTDASGERVDLRPGLFGVNGRNRLTANGEPVVPAGSGSFFARNPRTIAGTTEDGTIVLATIDGRQARSVGTTLDETALVAGALGLTDSINLDGGGSTTMVVGGTVVNRPAADGVERAVGDALVYIDAPR